ncbi:MAG TPA: alanine--tRNA ligase [Solirubrobacteraceae bacterium]|nr:alanine--tRNA ligase [Solirubrobacteraceae bacterium]
MRSDEIRERFQAFFEERGHLRIPSASLVPSAHDPSALLTVAGMHPLKPYFLGEERPPAPRVTDCQKVFRTVDIDNVGTSPSHLTFFEMLGNFSFGDYFKADAIAYAWQLSREVFGFADEDIWVTVFAGDEGLGLGPDEEAIGLWLDVGVPRERIVACPRSENFWEAGPTGPCGPCSELYFDRGVDFGSPDDLPGGENKRFLEFWNLVFMQYDQRPPGERTPLADLPARNIDTGMGLDRMAVLLQGVASVFETDLFAPLIALGEELSGARYGTGADVDRALRILADHARAMTFLTADGVVPSNEERGYVLRRVMRRAILQGRALELAPGFLVRYAERVREMMGGVYGELREQAEVTDTWLAAEEDGFGRTLEHGMALLGQLVERARAAGQTSVSAADVFQLHDTYGFPREMTEELLAADGFGVDGDVDALLEEQRRRGRATARGEERDTTALRAAAASLLADAPTAFTGYETERQQTSVLAVGDSEDGLRVIKLAESPFYAPGGGQVADVGEVEALDGAFRGRVVDVMRLGDDQALAVELEAGDLHGGEAVVAQVDAATRHATEANHTATHLLQAALRRVLGDHVRQAGSYVGPDKLRFDFSHGQALSASELAAVEDMVNDWISHNDRVHAITTGLAEAKRLGAMALFGEKYGEVVRLVEVGEGEYSRELCGGTHVRSTAEIGPFVIVAETSSAANVRRIEALTGPGAVALLRERDRLLGVVAGVLRTRREDAPGAVERLAAERRELERKLRAGGAAQEQLDLDAVLQAAEDIAGAPVLAASVAAADAAELMAVLDRVKGRLPGAAILLGASADGRVHLAAAVAPELVERGLRAGELVKVAAAEVGGGGGGRDTIAQAGGRDAARLPQAIEAGRAAIAAALAA